MSNDGSILTEIQSTAAVSKEMLEVFSATIQRESRSTIGPDVVQAIFIRLTRLRKDFWGIKQPYLNSGIITRGHIGPRIHSTGWADRESPGPSVACKHNELSSLGAESDDRRMPPGSSGMLEDQTVSERQRERQ